MPRASANAISSSRVRTWSRSGAITLTPGWDYDAFFAKTQELVTGEVRLSLQPGAPVVSGRRSEHALYSEELASYGIGETFPHQAAGGFIEITTLETQLVAARERVEVA